MKVHAPDIDIDFDLNRNEFIQKILPNLFKNQYPALISAFVTLNVKNSIQDILRVFNVPPSISINISKNIDEENWEESLREQLKDIEELKKAKDYLKGKNIIINNIEDYIINYVKKSQGSIRQATKHAAGIVILPEGDKIIPVKKNEPIPVVEFDLKQLEELNYLKIDLLTLRTLTIIQKTIDLIKNENQNNIIDLYDFDKIINCKEIFDLIEKNMLEGVFQLGTKGGMELCKTLKPKNFRDIVAINSLNRPGTKTMVEDFLKAEKTKFDFINEITEETNYIVLFQEQLNKILSFYLNIDEGLADLLRRELEKANSQIKKQEIYQKILKFALKNNKEENEIKDIFDLIIKSAGYLFNKSHAVCYSLLTCQTLYLKSLYPYEFYSVCLKYPSSTNEKDGIVNELKTLGIKLQNPDVNFSHYNDFVFDKNKKEIYYNLALIKGFSEETAELLTQLKPFKSFADFLIKVSKYKRKLTSAKIEILIKVGALRSLYANKKVLLLICNEIQKESKKSSFTINEGIIEYLFLKYKDEKDFTTLEQQMFAEEFLSIKTNLLENFFTFNEIKKIEEKGVLVNIEDYTKYDFETPFYALFELKSIKVITTKNNKQMCFLEAQDYFGKTFDITVFPKDYDNIKNELKEKNIYMCKLKNNVYKEKINFVFADKKIKNVLK